MQAPLPYNPGAPRHDEPLMSYPGTALRLHVPLTYFCTQYLITPSNQQKLQALEYQSGDKLVENLEENEWKGEAKFSALGWCGFLAAHRQFCESMKEGLWDTMPQ
jgi:hypothetical protein